MKKIFLILLLILGFQGTALCGSLGCEYKNIQIQWKYDNLHVKLDGFRLYQEGSWVCETQDPLSKEMICEVYLTPPAMRFSLTAFEKGGQESLPSEPFTIAIDTVEAALAADVATGTAPLTVNFDASGSRSCQGTIETYFWDFGDGETGSGEFATHLYLEAGTFNPTLYVTDSGGETAQLSQSITVSDPAADNVPPVAKITASAVTGFAPFSISLNANASSDPDGNLVHYFWNLGDGDSTVESSTSHIYTQPGEYIISLTVTDNFGATAEDQVSIIVTQPTIYSEANVNFQPDSAETPADFIADSGKAFTAGKGYGWVAGNTNLQTRDRNSSRSADQTYDTLVFARVGSVWEMAVQNGEYWVTVTVGDPEYPGTLNSVQVEGTPIIENAQLSTQTRWVEKTSRVSVADQRLSVTFTGSEPDAQLCRMKVMTQPPPSDAPEPIAPVPVINAKTTTQSPFVVYFNAESSYDSDGTIVDYLWNFGDGETGQGASLSHEFPMKSQFIATLDITDDSGETARAQTVLIIRNEIFHSQLFVNFQPTSAEIPDGFSADNGSAYSSTTGYGWTNGPFGDGTRDRNSSLSPDQSYDTLILAGANAVWEAAVPNGNYRVTLCAGDANYPVAVQNIRIEGTPLFTNEPLSNETRWLKASLDVTVNDGGLTVTFAGSDPFVQLCWISILDENHDDANIYPVAALDVNTNTHAPLWVSSSAANSQDIDGTIVSYLWDFGDGQTSSEVSVDHLYTDSGTYPITLTLTDNLGGTGQRRIWVSIPEGEHHEFSVNFQPAGASVPGNHLADSGGAFDESKGYGWTNRSSGIQTRDRNSSLSPDQKHDTLAFGPSDGIWEATVPDGIYRVTICIGDPEYPGSLNNVQVENISFMTNEQLGKNNRWVESSGWVQVKDGRLTVRFTGSEPYSQLCWIKVEN